MTEQLPDAAPGQCRYCGEFARSQETADHAALIAQARNSICAYRRPLKPASFPDLIDRLCEALLSAQQQQTGDEEQSCGK